MKSVLVTGGAKRIGAAISRALAEDGWFVHIHYRTSESEAAGLLREIEDNGGHGAICHADLGRPEDAEGLIGKIDTKTAPLTALINNASLFERDEIFGLSPEKFEQHMRVNLLAPLLLSKQFAAQAGKGEDACIVNILDNKIASLNPDHFSYTLSKVGLHGATQTMAMAMAPHVRVNGIAPGITLVSSEQSPEEFERCQKLSLLGRSCSAEEIAGAVRFILATPAYNGQVLTIDGGQSLMKLPRDVAFMPKDADGHEG